MSSCEKERYEKFRIIEEETLYGTYYYIERKGRCWLWWKREFEAYDTVEKAKRALKYYEKKYPIKKVVYES